MFIPIILIVRYDLSAFTDTIFPVNMNSLLGMLKAHRYPRNVIEICHFSKM
jgi:hypothetical protein